MSILPTWGRWTIIAVSCYAAIIFASVMSLTEGGAPTIRDGRFVISRHGTIVRELSADEYKQQKAYVARSFSGTWIAFYVLPAIFFLSRPRRRSR